MPEGPELKITANFLNKHLLNRNITLEVHKGRYTRHPMKNLDKVTFPLKVNKIGVKGKFIYFTFDKTEISMWVTLGMSGHFLLHNSEESPYFTKKHNNIAIHYGLKNPIWFQDYRNFGTFSFALKKEDLEKKLSKIGLDLLEVDTSFSDFYDILIKKRGNNLIGESLLEQKYISGVGNYCRSEALYLAEINPFVKVKQLSEKELKNLFHWIRVVLFYHYDVKLGLKYNILSEKDLKYFPKTPTYIEGSDYNFDFVVYGRKEDPLGNKIHRKKDKNGRTIHWVPEIQKK
jgi:endonuclease-8